MKAKYYKILWWSIPVAILLGLIGMRNLVELQLHAAYIVISSLQAAMICAIVLGLLGGLYWLLREFKLLHLLSVSHSCGTVMAIVGALLLAVFAPDNLHSVKINLLLLFFLLQILLILNVGLGLMRGRV